VLFFAPGDDINSFSDLSQGEGMGYQGLHLHSAIGEEIQTCLEFRGVAVVSSALAEVVYVGV
jgi:hypothetical protein